MSDGQQTTPPGQQTTPPAGGAGGARPAPYDGQVNRPQDAHGFWQRLADAVANLADVTVATLITDVRVSVDDRGRLKDVSTPQTDIPAIITNVNLVDGNVTTEIGESLKDDESLRTFHEGLVDRAVKVLPDNIKAFADLIERLVGKL